MKKFILGVAAVVLLIGSWWTYRLIWGKPLNINHFYERAFIEVMLDDPELLSQLGMIDNTLVDFHSDDLTDASPVHTQKLIETYRRNLEILRSYDYEDQTGTEHLSVDILEWFLDDEVRREEFMYHDYPINQLAGVQSELPSFMRDFHQVIDKQSAKNYISRLSKFGIKFDQVLVGLKLREGEGIIPPKFVIEKVLVEMRNFVDQPVEQNILFTSFKEKLEKVEELNEAQKEELCEQVRAEIRNTVYPANEKLIRYFEALETKATADDGVWKFPNGDAYYAYLVRHHTTTDLTPEEVHQLGLREVARIQSEMRTILDSLGYTDKTVAEHMQDFSQEERFLYPNNKTGREQALAHYRAMIDEIDQNLLDISDLRPQASLEVRRVPEFKEETSYFAYYNAPAMDGSRPGVFYANLRDMTEIPKYGMRTLAYHEAIPGHHLQMGFQREMEGVPTFRRVLPFTAYAEGWALYAERLTWENGFHNDPYDNLGRLQAELFRATRLVVDTGIHHKQWTREQAIEYMLVNTGMPEGEVVAEVERYIVDPGQALAYKIGMLKILELREKAQQELGNQFDIREFHNVVLQNGAMPLNILDEVVGAYINEKKAG